MQRADRLARRSIGLTLLSHPTIIWHDGVATSDGTRSRITWPLDEAP